ncbi:ankyrin repeat-containing domain protein [Mycena leptocephala]|nr:ankyrin repeat-containing domain protein [Mycena leptocephala]
MHSILPPPSRFSPTPNQTHYLLSLSPQNLSAVQPHISGARTCAPSARRSLPALTPSSTSPSTQLNGHLSRTRSAQGAPQADEPVKDYYNEKWEEFSKGIIYIDRLFEPLTVPHAKNKHKKVVDMDTVVNVALRTWKRNVVENLETPLRRQTTRDNGAELEVDRVVALFMSGDWTRADFWNMKIKSDGDLSALAEASGHGRTEIVRLLLEDATDMKSTQQHDSALQAASSSGHISIVRLLLEKGANLNDAPGGPALQTASGSGQIEIVRVLLASGADVNASGGKYGSSLQAAAYQGHGEIVHLLLDAGANVNAQGGLYNSALQAASAGHEEIVHLLLKAASYHRHGGIVHLLVKAGANVNTLGGVYGSALQAASWLLNALYIFEVTMVNEKEEALYQHQVGQCRNRSDTQVQQRIALRIFCIFLNHHGQRKRRAAVPAPSEMVSEPFRHTGGVVD